MSIKTTNLGLDKPEMSDRPSDTIPQLANNFDLLDTQLAQMTSLDTTKENVAFGAELLDATGWTSTGWTGDFTTGFTHTVGQSIPLRRTVPITAGKMYQVQLRLTPTCQLDGGNGTSDFTISIGGSPTFVTYQGAADTKLYSFGIVAPNTGDLVITPEPRYTGVITELSLKEITSQLQPSLQIKDTTGASAFEMRPTKSSLQNVFMGHNVGRYNTTGNQNAVIGYDAFTLNTSGYWNVGLGYNALANNSVGSRNVAMGFLALAANVSGHRNVALGSYALNANTDGANNIAIGADTIWLNTTGSGNIGIGLATLAANTTGNDNIALGIGALGNGNITGERNVAIGRSALNNSNGSDSIAIGRSALFSSTSGVNIALGYYSQYDNLTGTNNISLGYQTLQHNNNGGWNIALGLQAGQSTKGATINHNILIGYQTGMNLDTGADYNLIIGSNSGVAMTTGTRNVVLGPSSGATVTTGSKNILIGWAVDVANPTDTQKLNIGNALYGDLVTKYISIGTPPDISTDALLSGMALQIGKATSKGKLDLRYGTNITDTDLGGVVFGNLNNLNNSASTRTFVAGILASSVTSNSNVNGDSGGYLRFMTKGDAGGCNENMRLDSKGNLGIGLIIPTAKLHLRAGTATAGTAPLKLTAGTNLTTPENGAIEFDGNNLFITINGVRKTIQVA